MTSLTDVLANAARQAAAAADLLAELDGVAGDGDMGATVTTASLLLEELLPTLVDRPTGEVLHACGLTLATGAPSTIGTLVATGLLRAATAAHGLPEGTAPSGELAELLSAAAHGIGERGGATPGSKTILDALVPAVEAARHAAASGETLPAALRRAAEAADAGAAQTATMEAVHGRAGWLAIRSYGHEDAGARLAAIALEAAASAAAGPATGSGDA